MSTKHRNMNDVVVRDFGSEWSRFDQSDLSVANQAEIFEGYFHIFPWNSLLSGSVGADIGCGSGRWASLAAARVGLFPNAWPLSYYRDCEYYVMRTDALGCFGTPHGEAF